MNSNGLITNRAWSKKCNKYSDRPYRHNLRRFCGRQRDWSWLSEWRLGRKRWPRSWITHHYLQTERTLCLDPTKGIRNRLNAKENGPKKLGLEMSRMLP